MISKNTFESKSKKFIRCKKTTHIFNLDDGMNQKRRRNQRNDPANPNNFTQNRRFYRKKSDLDQTRDIMADIDGELKLNNKISEK